MLSPKTFLSTLFLLLFAYTTFAQSLEEGKIVYAQTMNYGAWMGTDTTSELSEKLTAVMEQFFPSMDQLHLTLYFDEQQYVVRDENFSSENAFGGVLQKMEGGESYFNKEAMVLTVIHKFDGQTYRIDSLVNSSPLIKKEDDTRLILGYTCHKAIITTNHPMTVWYTPDLPAGYSPTGYCAVDGLVLAVETDAMSYEAIEITAAKWPGVDYSDCQVTTHAEMNARVMELMKEEMPKFFESEQLQALLDSLEQVKDK